MSKSCIHATQNVRKVDVHQNNTEARCFVSAQCKVICVYAVRTGGGPTRYELDGPGVES